MNLSIIHYHLHAGGVTRIIQSQINALAGVSTVRRIRLFAGGIPDPALYDGIELVIEPSLNYLAEDWKPARYRESAAGLSAWLRSRLPKDDIVHVHNPTLGKNPLLTYALSQLAEEGQGSLYHCHDFPDERPDRTAFNSRILEDILGHDMDAVLYPRSASCRFGVLNSRDYRLLEGKGIESRRIHFLPNPVRFAQEELSLNKRTCREQICRRLGIPEGKTIFLYPVRIIRRKNIGEMILFSQLFAGRAVWLVTMAPHNPLEVTDYRAWKAFARRPMRPYISKPEPRYRFPF